jgi:hypothetical protein
MACQEQHNNLQCEARDGIELRWRFKQNCNCDSKPSFGCALLVRIMRVQRVVNDAAMSGCRCLFCKGAKGGAQEIREFINAGGMQRIMRALMVG